MNRPGQVLLQVVLIVAIVALYHLLFHGDAQPSSDPELRADPAADGPRAATPERDELERMLREAAGLGEEPFDPEAMRAIVARADATFSPAEIDAVLPTLHAHLRLLRENLQVALDALDRGAGPAERTRYRVRAVQQHGRFQAELRKTLTDVQARSLFEATPPMVPPMPSTTGNG